ncbi:MAG: pyridoxamine 5-phosphate oxidase [Pseudomonadota bacterium]
MARDPFRPVDDEARAMAQNLVSEARHGALATTLDGAPFVTRIAVAPCELGLVTLVSDLAPHTGALRTAPEGSLLIGEPGRGDPLAHPRVTLQVRAAFLEKTEDHMAAYLSVQPKAKLYIGFGDFHLVRLDVQGGLLNGGFGKAYRLEPSDLGSLKP